MEITTLNLPQIGELSKAIFEEKAAQAANLVHEGHIYPKDLFIQLSAMGFIIDLTLDKIKSSAIAQHENEKNKKYDGVQVKHTQGHDILDYDSDDEYTRLKAKLKARKEVLDAARVMHLKGLIAFDEGTGEQIEPPKVKNTTKESLACIFNK